MRAIALAALVLVTITPGALAGPCFEAPLAAAVCLDQSSTQSGPYEVTEAGASAATPLAGGAVARAYAGCATDGQGSGCDYATQGLALAIAAIALDARLEHQDTPFGERVCFSPQPGEGTCLGLPLP